MKTQKKEFLSFLQSDDSQVYFNKDKFEFYHKSGKIEIGQKIEKGEHHFVVPPYSVAFSKYGQIALDDLSAVEEEYIGKKPNNSGGYDYYYTAKSLSYIKNEDGVITEYLWIKGNETELGKIVEIGKEIAVVEYNGVRRPVYKSALKPSMLQNQSVRNYSEAYKIYRSLRENVKEDYEKEKVEKLTRSVFGSFKKIFNPQPKKEKDVYQQMGDVLKKTSNGGNLNPNASKDIHSLQHIHFDINSPTRKTFTYKNPAGQLYTSHHYLNEQGIKSPEPDNVKKFKMFVPGQNVIHSSTKQPHTIEQVGKTNVAAKDASGKIKVYKKDEFENDANHPFDPFKEPIVKSYKMPGADKYNFHESPAGTGTNQFLKDVKEGSFIEFPQSHPEYKNYVNKFNSNIVRVSRKNSKTGNVLLSSPITTKDYKIYHAEPSHFNMPSEKLEDEYSNIANKVAPGNKEAQDYLDSLKARASSNSSTIAAEISKEREHIDAIKEAHNTGKGKNTKELADAVKRLKILDDYQGVKKVFSTSQKMIVPGSNEHDAFLKKGKEMEALGFSKMGEGSDYRMPFRHNLFDFELTINPISGNINSNIKNTQPFKVGKKPAEIIHYNPILNKVSVKVGNDETPVTMSLDDLKKIPGSEQYSGFAKNQDEYNNPIAGEKENYGKGSFQHKEFHTKANELKSKEGFKHIAQDSDDFKSSFYHDKFGRFELKYNPSSGQKMVEFTKPKEFKLGSKVYVPTEIDPFNDKIKFHGAGELWKKKFSEGNISDLVKDIATQERLRSEVKKTKLSQAVEETTGERKAKVNDAIETYKNKLFKDMHTHSGGQSMETKDIENYLNIKNQTNSELSDDNLKKTMDNVHSEINESNPYSKISDIFEGDHNKLKAEYDKYLETKAGAEKIEKDKAIEKERVAVEKSKALEQSHEFQQNKKYTENYKAIPYIHEKEHTIEGKETKLRLKDAGFDNLKAKFHIVNLDDAIASHIPSLNDQPFEKNPAYPEGVQAKSYHEKNETASAFRKMVHGVAKNFNPEEIINSGIQGNDNAPVADKKGVVLGGNSRTMGSKLHTPEDIEKRRQEILKRLDDFVDVKDDKHREELIDKINKNPNPFVMRVVDYDLSKDSDKPEDLNENFGNYNRLSAVLNSAQNAEISNEDLKKTNIQKVSDLIPDIAGIIGGKQSHQLSSDETAKIKKLLTSRLKEDQLAKYFQGNTLADDGHSFLKGILSANAIDNEKTRKILEKHPIGSTIINNINNAPMWNQIQNITKEAGSTVYSLQKDLDKTIVEMRDRTKNKSKEDIPQSMFETPLRQRVLYDVLSDETGDKLKNFTDQYHSFIKKQNENNEQDSMFTTGTPEEMIDRFYQKFEKDNPSKLHLDKLKAAISNKSVNNIFKKKIESKK